VQDVTSPTYLSGDNISCFEAADGSIDYTISGGSPGYVYSWDNGSTTEDLADLGPGTYVVTVTDINGCSIDTTIVLTEPTPLVQDITSPTYPSGDNISCFEFNDGSIDYTISGGSPGYVYVWSNGSTTEDISTLVAGTYTVTVTDINGCSIDTTITLVEPTPLDISLVPSVYAGGFNTTGCDPDGEIDLTIAGGSAGYVITWSNGETTEDIVNLTAGTYDVTVVDINGCTITDQITLTAPDLFQSDLTSPTYNGGWNISCNGFIDGSINLDITGGTSPFLFQWSNGSNSQNLSNLGAGEYSVIITDANGCLGFDTIVLTEPDLLTSSAFVLTDYNGSDISCFGADDASITVEIQGGTPQYVYQWTQGGTNVSANITANGVGPGTYFVTVTDANGCTTTSDVLVEEPPVVTVSIDILSDYFGLPVSCVGNNDGEVEAIGNGGWGGLSYQWNTTPTITSANIDTLGVGNYTVIATDINGCFASSSVLLEGHPAPSFEVPPYQQLCEGETASFMTMANGNDFNCTWEFSTGQVVNSCEPFDIAFGIVGCIDATVTLTSSEGCVSQQIYEDYVCYDPNPIAEFTQSAENITTVPSDVSFYNQSTNGYSYEWDFGDGYISNQENPTHYFPDDAAGTYQVTLLVTSMFGCVDSTFSMVYVKEELIIYVPNTFTPDGNAHNEMFLPILSQGFDPYDYQLLIFNRWGELLFESYNHQIGWDGTYGGNIVKDGTYVWKIRVGSNSDGFRKEFVGHVNVLR
jgi:gliding motility-associated-like protein